MAAAEEIAGFQGTDAVDDTQHSASEWSYIVTPLGISESSSQVRSDAIRAAVECLREDSEIATQLARRFLYNDSDLNIVAKYAEAENEHTKFLRAWTSWMLHTGAVQNVSQKLELWDEKCRGRRVVLEEIIVCLKSQEQPDTIAHWSASLMGRSGNLDRAIISIVFYRFAFAREEDSTVTAVLLRGLRRCSHGDNKARAGVLAAIFAPSENLTVTELSMVDPVVPSNSQQSPTAFFDIFVHGFLHVQGNGPLSLERCSPPDFLEHIATKRQPDYYLILCRFLWQAGCLAGLLFRNQDLILEDELQQVIGVFLALPAHDHFDLYSHTLHICSELYLPTVVRLLAGGTALHATAHGEISSFLEKSLGRMSHRIRGALESLWMLAPVDWTRVAEHSMALATLPGTDAEERKEWFDYWLSTCVKRGVAFPKDFEECGVAASLGAREKEDFIGLVVDLVVSDLNSLYSDERLVHTMDLLTRLANSSGGRSARYHMPTLLAAILRSRPDKFVSFFKAATGQPSEIEPFGSLSVDLVNEWLNHAEAKDNTQEELLAAWHWMTSCPGALYGRDDVVRSTVSLFENMHAHEEVKMIQRWSETYRSPKSEEEITDTDTMLSEPTQPTKAEMRDVRFRWIAGWYSEEEQIRLHAYVSKGGDEALAYVCERIALDVAHGDKIHLFEYLEVARGLLILFPSLGTNSVLVHAFDYADMKVRFQRGLDPNWLSYHKFDNTAAIFIYLAARGLDVSHTDTLKWSIRSLASLARHEATSGLVQNEILLRLKTGDTLAKVTCLLLLRECKNLSDVVLAALENAGGEDDIWCRWLVSRVTGTEPQWLQPRVIAGLDGIVVTGENFNKDEIGAVYYSGETQTLDVYARKFGAAVKVTQHDIRSQLALEVSLVESEYEPRTPGWHHGRGAFFSETQYSVAAGRQACRLASNSEVQTVPPLLSIAAHFDPWLVLAEPNMRAPDGWIELAIGERTEKRYLLRTLVLAYPDLDVGSVGEDDLGLYGMAHVFSADGDSEFVWVCDDWPPSMEGPADSAPPGPAISLAVLNRPFTCLGNDQFPLVPRWKLPFFRSLQYVWGPRPGWVDPELGPVILAVKEERILGHRPAEVEWRSGWYINPVWVKKIAHFGKLFHCWRLDRQQWGQEPETTWGSKELETT